MAQPYVGQLLLAGCNFTPVGRLPCNGRLMAISDFTDLFQLIGTTYGGDGQSTFAVPGLRGRVPVHQGASYAIGQAAGVEQVTLTANQMPRHSHAALCSSASQNSNDPAGSFLAVAGDHRYGPIAAAPMANGMISSVGGSQPHDNLQPYLVLNWIIALQGAFPARN